MNFASLLTILTLIEERAAMARKAFAQALYAWLVVSSSSPGLNLSERSTVFTPLENANARMARAWMWRSLGSLSLWMAKKPAHWRCTTTLRN